MSGLWKGFVSQLCANVAFLSEGPRTGLVHAETECGRRAARFPIGAKSLGDIRQAM